MTDDVKLTVEDVLNELEPVAIKARPGFGVAMTVEQALVPSPEGIDAEELLERLKLGGTNVASVAQELFADAASLIERQVAEIKELHENNFWCASHIAKQEAEIERQTAELREAKAEVNEQARLNGMGASRELKLMAEIERLRGALTDIANKYYDWETAKEKARSALSVKDDSDA